MSEPFRRIIGQRILSTEQIHDYTQLRFSDGGMLNVFNPLSIDGSDLTGIVGKVIEEVKANDDAVILVLTNAARLRVSLLDIDYSGPECMQYIAQDGQIVVWP